MKAEEGALAPDFLLGRLDGSELRLSDLRGQPVVLNFWATWCAPCRQEIPQFVDAFDRFRDQGLVVVGVNMQEGKSIVRPYAEDFGMEFPIVIDVDGEVGDAYPAPRPAGHLLHRSRRRRPQRLHRPIRRKRSWYGGSRRDRAERARPADCGHPPRRRALVAEDTLPRQTVATRGWSRSFGLAEPAARRLVAVHKRALRRRPAGRPLRARPPRRGPPADAAQRPRRYRRRTTMARCPGRPVRFPHARRWTALSSSTFSTLAGSPSSSV